MHTLGIDPGASPGYVIIRNSDAAILAWAQGEIWPSEPFVVAVERPEIRSGARRRIAPQAVVTLAIDAGWRAGRASAHPLCRGIVWLRPSEWKRQLMPGNVEKAVFCARLARDHGLPFDPRNQMDLIDAWALAYVASSHARGSTNSPKTTAVPSFSGGYSTLTRAKKGPRHSRT